MESVGKFLRLSRLLRSDGRTLVVAMDHGMIGITKGIEDIVDVVEKVVEGGADGLLVNIGAAKKIIEHFGKK